MLLTWREPLRLLLAAAQCRQPGFGLVSELLADPTGTDSTDSGTSRLPGRFVVPAANRSRFGVSADSQPGGLVGLLLAQEIEVRVLSDDVEATNELVEFSVHDVVIDRRRVLGEGLPR